MHKHPHTCVYQYICIMEATPGAPEPGVKDCHVVIFTPGSEDKTPKTLDTGVFGVSSSPRVDIRVPLIN